MLQDEIIRLWEEDRRTVVLITNDVDEAALMADRIIPLTPGPAARLEKDFSVDLERPRDRTTLNFNPTFKTLRSSVSRFMNDLNQEAKALRVSAELTAPTLVPRDFAAPAVGRGA